MSVRKRKNLFLGGRELQRAVGLTRWTAGRLALKGQLPFILGDDGFPRFSLVDAQRIAAEREAKARCRHASKWSKQAGGDGSDRRA